MLIEVVALEPPHHDKGVITIHLKKLLTGEAREVNSLNAVFGGGLSQEKTCYCVECDKFFHGSVPCLAYGMRSLPNRTTRLNDVSCPIASYAPPLFNHLVGLATPATSRNGASWSVRGQCWITAA